MAQLLEKVDELTQPLEVSLGPLGLALSRWELLCLARMGPAHGNGRVRAIGQAQDQVGIDAAADVDDLTSLAIEGMMRMGDGHVFQRRLRYRCSVLWGFQRWRIGCGNGQLHGGCVPLTHRMFSRAPLESVPGAIRPWRGRRSAITS